MISSLINSKSRKLILLGFLLFFASCRTVKIFTDDALSISRENHVGFFPGTISESSGLEVLDDSLVTFNDSGGDASLFFFSPLEPEKPQKLWINNALNVDWEDISYDGQYIYVGDVGNNLGIRDTLVIYKIPVNQLRANYLNPFIISFCYMERDPEYTGIARNAFDCEAMAIINDSLWLFTKNWEDKSSWVYKLALEPGHYNLARVDVLNPGMLVTGADYCPESKVLILSGYNHNIPRIRAYSINQEGFRDIFKINFFNRPGLQTEGITILNDNTVYFSNEKSIKKQGIFKFTISKK